MTDFISWGTKIIVDFSHEIKRHLLLGRKAKTNLDSVLKEINSEYSLELLMLRLQYFSHLMGRADLLEKTLMHGKHGVLTTGPPGKSQPVERHRAVLGLEEMSSAI